MRAKLTASENEAEIARSSLAAAQQDLTQVKKKAKKDEEELTNKYKDMEFKCLCERRKFRDQSREMRRICDQIMIRNDRINDLYKTMSDYDFDDKEPSDEEA